MSEIVKYHVKIGDDTLSDMRSSEQDFTFIMQCEENKKEIKTSKEFAILFTKKAEEKESDGKEKQSYKIEYDIKNRKTFTIMKKVIENGKYEGEQPECVCEELFNIGYELSRPDMMNSYFNILSSRDIKEEDVDHYLSCAEKFGEPLKKKVVKYIAQNFHMLSDRILYFVSKYGVTLIEEIAKDQDFKPMNEDEYAHVVYKICQEDDIRENDEFDYSVIPTIYSPYVSAEINGDIFDMYIDLVMSKLKESDGEDVSFFHSFFKKALSPITDKYPRKTTSDRCFDDLCKYDTFHNGFTLDSLKSKLSNLSGQDTDEDDIGEQKIVLEKVLQYIDECVEDENIFNRTLKCYYQKLQNELEQKQESSLKKKLSSMRDEYNIINESNKSLNKKIEEEISMIVDLEEEIYKIEKDIREAQNINIQIQQQDSEFNNIVSDCLQI